MDRIKVVGTLRVPLHLSMTKLELYPTAVTKLELYPTAVTKLELYPTAVTKLELYPTATVTARSLSGGGTARGACLLL